MATSKEYAGFVMARFSRLADVVTARPMMGEYVIHFAGRVLGFIADDQLLLQNTPTIQTLLPENPRRELFPGSKLLCIIEDSMGPQQLCEIAQAIYDELPVSKPRKSKKKPAPAATPAFPFEKFSGSPSKD